MLVFLPFVVIVFVFPLWALQTIASLSARQRSSALVSTRQRSSVLVSSRQLIIVSSSARQLVSSSAHQLISSSARQLVSLSACQLVSLSSAPARGHGGLVMIIDSSRRLLPPSTKLPAQGIQ